jgi:hypothetical protein
MFSTSLEQTEKKLFQVLDLFQVAPEQRGLTAYKLG